MDKEYTVRIHFTSFVDVKVKATSEREAYTKAELSYMTNGGEGRILENLIQADASEIIEEGE